MKRISIVTLAAALVLLSGCNKEHTTSVDIDLDNGSDMQLIKLGGSTGVTSAVTRASIESLAEMTGQMGIFCLAARETDAKSANKRNPINWLTPVSSNLDEYGSTTNGRYWSNVCCEVKPEGDIFRIEPTADQTCYRYYPTTSLYGYDFYGYYPFQANRLCTYTDDSIYVDFVIDGTQDIIYGRSEVINQAYVDSLEGELSDELKNKLASNWKETMIKSHYSARFFRKHPQPEVNDARMMLNHKLARFRFYAYPGPDKDYASEKSYAGATKLHVRDISISGVENKLRLVIAHKEKENRSGALYAIPSTNPNSTFVLRHKDNGYTLANDRAERTWIKTKGDGTPDTIQLGDCIMLLPGKSEYLMSVLLAEKKDDGSIVEYPSETQIAIRFADKSGNKKFEAGKTYNVYLQVSGIKEIGVTAELADWEDSKEPMDLVEFN